MQLGSGPEATAVKLMQIGEACPARIDNQFLTSSYGIRYLTMYVADFHAALKQAEAQGVKPLARGPQTIPASVVEGMDIALVRDPDGNIIEIVGPTP